ncbi:MAG TPA: hypothetical protein VMX54_12165 [Vicinamibacteria bacterium]|nr:hypothetical protein [Vicinamibacteria bacterium]
MMTNPRRLLLLAAAVLLLSAPFLSAADTPKAVGTWDVVANTPNGDLSSVMTVKVVDGKLTVEFELGGLARTVTDEKLDKNVLTMKVEYEGALYDVEAKIDGDKVEGTWQGNGVSGTLTGKRRP